MKVILLEDIKGLGKKFEVKEIKDGYARNFLMPKNLVQAATKINLEIINRQKSVWEKKEKEITAELKKIAGELEAASLDFSLKIGEGGQAFGSISALDVLKALENLEALKPYSEKIKKFELALEKPIKELGEQLVEINLGKGIKTKVRVRVHSQP